MEDISKDELFLLSEEEFDRYKELIPPLECIWWLRTDSNTDNRNVMCVDDNGKLDREGWYKKFDKCGVRPACKISDKDEEFLVGDTRTLYGIDMTKIDEGLYIAKKTLGLERTFFKDYYNPRSGNREYDKCDIRHFLNEYAECWEKIKPMNEHLKNIGSFFRTEDGENFVCTDGVFKGIVTNLYDIYNAEDRVMSLEKGEDVFGFNPLLMQNMCNNRGFSYNGTEHTLTCSSGSVANYSKIIVHSPRSGQSSLEHGENIKACYTEYESFKECGIIECDWTRKECGSVAEVKLLDYLDRKGFTDFQVERKKSEEKKKDLYAKLKAMKESKNAPQSSRKTTLNIDSNLKSK